MAKKDILSYNFSKRLTQRAKNSFTESFNVARKYPAKGTSDKVTTTHLLYALAEEEGSIAKNILTSHGIKKSHIAAQLKKNARSVHTKSTGNKTPQDISPSYKRVLKKAANYAMKNNQHFIGTEHILMGVMHETHDLGIIPPPKVKAIRAHLDEIILSSISIDMLSGGIMEHDHASSWLAFEEHDGQPFTPKKNIRPVPRGSKLPEETKKTSSSETNQEKYGHIHTKTKPKRTTILETFCENLSQKAAQGELDPLAGREQEIQRLSQILLRKNKSNPLLVGDPGVGKTALVQGLAQQIVAGTVHQSLLNKRIYSLNLSSLIAGTMFRGEFEERMRDLVEEASQEDIILFIDEVHTLIGAGSAQGSLDAANIIKPALVKGTFQCIGATTHEEYKKSIEKDGALDRRFQKMNIQEETREDSIKTLTRLLPIYEKHHDVTIPSDILNLCVDLSIKYLPARALPDKAIDILDEAASATRARTIVDETEKYIRDLTNERLDVIKQKEEALSREQYKKAMLLKNRQESLEYALKKIKSKHTATPTPQRVTQETVYHVVSEMTSLPLSSLTRQESAHFNDLETTLKKYIIGQPHALRKVASALKRSRAGIRNEERPIASYLFMGPSGVGKTELARVLANTLTDDPGEEKRPRALIRLDMSELSEAHTIARLIGAPPGYVGYEDGGLLTDKIRKTPHSVVLFDEIEKAHPKVLDTLLQILEDGALTDSHGKTAIFKNAIIILTSNIGTPQMRPNASLGFETQNNAHTIDHAQAISILKETVRPEVINRIDDIVIFEHLDKKSLEAIANNQLNALQKRITNRVKMEYTPSVGRWIVKRAHGQESGARAIRKIIEEHIEEHIAARLLKHAFKKIKISVKDNTLAYTFK